MKHIAVLTAASAAALSLALSASMPMPMPLNDASTYAHFSVSVSALPNLMQMHMPMQFDEHEFDFVPSTASANEDDDDDADHAVESELNSAEIDHPDADAAADAADDYAGIDSIDTISVDGDGGYTSGTDGVVVYPDADGDRWFDPQFEPSEDDEDRSVLNRRYESGLTSEQGREIIRPAKPLFRQVVRSAFNRATKPFKRLKNTFRRKKPAPPAPAAAAVPTSESHRVVSDADADVAGIDREGRLFDHFTDPHTGERHSFPRRNRMTRAHHLLEKNQVAHQKSHEMMRRSAEARDEMRRRSAETLKQQQQELREYEKAREHGSLADRERLQPPAQQQASAVPKHANSRVQAIRQTLARPFQRTPKPQPKPRSRVYMPGPGGFELEDHVPEPEKSARRMQFDRLMARGRGMFPSRRAQS